MGHKILQANLNRARAAQDLLLHNVANKDIDIALISEPHKTAGEGWNTDTRGMAAIYTPRKTIVTEYGNGPGFSWVQADDIVYYSCYYSPNDQLQEFEADLLELARSIRTQTSPTIVGGDFNSKAADWGEHRLDRRGEIVCELIAELDMQVCNTGCEPTFRRGNAASIIDVTMASQNIHSKVIYWRVSQEVTLSDHNYISFEVGKDNQTPTQTTIRGWVAKKIDNEKMKEALLHRLGGRNITTAEELLKIVEKVCDDCMPRRRPHRRGRGAYWWNSEIAELRKACFAARRRFQRKMKRTRYEEAEEEELASKRAHKELAKAIKKSKKAHWDSIVEEVDRDVWGLGYKIVTKKLGRPSIPGLTTERMGHIVTTLFPTHDKFEPEKKPVERANIRIFTVEELGEAVKSIPKNKAPGPDGIPSSIVRGIAETCPKELLQIYNNYLLRGVYPGMWKMARLTLIRKGDKPLEEPTSYRPICLLDDLGKLFERLLVRRLQQELEANGGLAENQFGFRKGLSTTNALERIIEKITQARMGTWRTRKLVAVVTVDVRNAFNSVSWRNILAAATNRRISAYLYNMLADYLSKRSLLANEETYEITSGVAQGSVLGPTLWNLSYDEALRLRLPEGVTLVGFADDITIIASARREEDLVERTNLSLAVLRDWMTAHGLKMVPEKTEALLTVGRRKTSELKFSVENKTIIPQATITSLGITLDKYVNFKVHLQKAAEKASRMQTALQRLMPNVKGARASKRKVLSAVTHSILLYGAPIWCEAMKVATYRNILLGVQRRTALRVISAYRTAPLNAVLVLAGSMPIDLQASLRQRTYRGEDKAVVNDDLRRKWQDRWDADDKGRWTHTLIPVISEWIDRGHGEVDFHITQILTGHGCFNSYLHRMKLRPTPACRYCINEDTPYHTIFECEKWQAPRQAVYHGIGKPLTPTNTVTEMLASEESWDLICNFFRQILKEKEEDERRDESVDREA